jgi:hypothetical protein
MNSSPELKELATALAKAQGVMEGAKKDAANPFFKSRYADLESVWNACRLALTANGLSVVQGMNDQGFLSTRLLHSSGQWLEGFTPVKAKDDSPQALGSALTYARRYGLAAIAGIHQTDDDAEAAQGRPSAPQRRDFSPRPEGVDEVDPLVVRKWCKAFRDALADRNDERVCKGLDDLNADMVIYTAVWDHLEPKERSNILDAAQRARQERGKVKASF